MENGGRVVVVGVNGGVGGKGNGVGVVVEGSGRVVGMVSGMVWENCVVLWSGAVIEKESGVVVVVWEGDGVKGEDRRRVLDGGIGGELWVCHHFVVVSLFSFVVVMLFFVVLE